MRHYPYSDAIEQHNSNDRSKGKLNKNNNCKSNRFNRPIIECLLSRLIHWDQESQVFLCRGYNYYSITFPLVWSCSFLDWAEMKFMVDFVVAIRYSTDGHTYLSGYKYPSGIPYYKLGSVHRSELSSSL